MRRPWIIQSVTLAFAVISMSHSAGQQSASPKKVASNEKPQSQNEAFVRLLKIQLQAAQKAYRAAVDTLAVQRVGGLLVQVKDTNARPDHACTWSVRWLRAQYDLSETKEQKIGAFVEHRERMKQLRETVRMLVGDGSGGILQSSESPAAEWYLAEAELWLLNEQAK